MEAEYENTPKLGFGCMRLPLLDAEDQTSIDIEQVKKMVDVFVENGGTYFDTAFVYHDGASETALKTALVNRYPRESFTLATKCLAWALPDKKAAQACLDTSLERLGTDYVDYYLLHNVGGERTAKFDEYDMWNFAQEQKAAGKIRHVGLSIHDGADCLEKLLNEHPEMEFVQLQVNYLDWEDPVTESRKCMEVAAKYGKPVVIMEPARGGRLSTMPERVADVFGAIDPSASGTTWAYRFCWNLPGVLTVLSGMSTLEQAQENTAAYAANKPFTAAEEDAYVKAAAALRDIPSVPCTNCRYCVKDCPQNVNIPQIMSLLNLGMMVEDEDFAKELYQWQTLGGRASQCIECGTCESMCPQSIDIINQLHIAEEKFEG